MKPWEQYVEVEPVSAKPWEQFADMEPAPVKRKNLQSINTKPTFAERNIAPALESLYAATGLGSQPVQDFAVGASGLMRGGANLVKSGAGETLFPSKNSTGSGYQTAGELLDPVAMAAGEGAFRLGAKAIPYVKGGANYLMQSALKPTIADLKKGNASIAVNTLLKEGLNATKGGVEKLRNSIYDTGGMIDNVIANSKGTVDKNKVLNYLDPTVGKFTKQVSPQSDLNAISNVRADFINHPSLTGQAIPVQVAQNLKRGTQQSLSKKYGQLGSAEVEAQKSLARGLREEISNAVPEIAKLNAREANLIKTLNVTERRALMDANKNPMGLALLAQNPASWAAFMADKSALFKSLAARSINSSANILPYGAQMAGYGSAQSVKGLLSE